MSQGNIILDIRRFEKFEYGSDRWIFHKEISDWRTLAQLSIDAALRNDWKDFCEVHKIIEDVYKFNLEEDYKVFWEWVRSGIELKNCEGSVKGFRDMEYKIYFGGYVFPYDDEYDILENLGFNIKRIREVGSYWFRKGL
jgi:hypothetical protein